MNRIVEIKEVLKYLMDKLIVCEDNKLFKNICAVYVEWQKELDYYCKVK